MVDEAEHDHDMDSAPKTSTLCQSFIWLVSLVILWSPK